MRWLFLILFVGCSGCEPPRRTRVTPPELAQELVKNMTVIQAKNGLCFGVVTDMTFSTQHIIVAVDCAQAGL